MKITLSIATLFSFGLITQAAFADCPDLSGVYLLNVGSISSTGSISPSNLSPGSCQYHGSSAPILVGTFSDSISSISASSFPSGIVRVYVYKASSTQCDYVSFTSAPKQGQSPYLDTKSYADFKNELPANLEPVLTGSYNGDWDSYNKMTAITNNDSVVTGGILIRNTQNNSDGSVVIESSGYSNQPSSDNGFLGLNVKSGYQTQVVLQTNGNILTQEISTTSGRSFWIVPVSQKDQSVCLLQKVQ